MRFLSFGALLVAALLCAIPSLVSGLLLRQPILRQHAFATSAAEILELPLEQSAMHFDAMQLQQQQQPIRPSGQRDQPHAFDTQGVGGFGPGLPPPPPFPFFGGGHGHGHGHGSGGGGLDVTPLPLVAIRPVTIAQSKPAQTKKQPVIDVDVMVPQIVRQTVVQPYVQVNTVITQVPVNEYSEAAPITEKARVIQQGTVVQPTISKKGGGGGANQQPSITLVQPPA